MKTGKRQTQLTQWFSLFAGMFASFRTQTFAGRYTIPTAAQKAAANLITSFAALGGRDELDSDPAVEKLRNTIQTSRLGTVENIAAQSKLKDIFAARDQIAKAQWAYKIYEEFGNKAQMNAVNRQAEEARQKLESMEVDKIHYEAGKDLSVYFKQPAVQACDYDPSITTQHVPLLQNEEYLLLLRLAMEKTPAGENAKSQLEAKRLEIEEAERQLALDAETGKKTYNFDEYTKTLWGNTWVLSKNGKTDREAAQASMAYNEAIKNGEIKSYQENVPVDYLTEQILAAKNGTNYWTGEKISKLQAYGIIVSSLITTFQGIESFRGSLKRNLPLHPGANEIPASRVKQPKVSVPEVTVPKPVEPVGKIAEGTGEGRLKPTKLSSERTQLDWLPDKYTAVEVKGSVKVAGKDVDVSRRVYQIEIDKNYVPKDPAAGGLTNKELMSKGKSPYVAKDGVESKVELHHLIQKEPGGMVEIAESTHDKYSSQLHGLVEDGNSFRNDPLLEKQYNNFRSNYWKMRANEE
ncbi:HNH/ENDO VII family nuclease [Paenibacillus sp. P3E]|uniref:HNH/ENDO VII family nuclease n=1 Tax=Paenibacillus sp. P3E TaxID=1349435 RepID=UPI000A8AC91C|nr:HNH/ENDO VII family nuclease [Paenibacillus sp. P3E]